MEIIVNKLDAIKFLEKHQPLPADSELTQSIIDKYEEIIKFFIANPDDEIIPYLLNSYGEGDGWGTYVLVEDYLYRCSKKAVVEEIRKILEQENNLDSIRYWVTQNAAAFPDPIFKKGLFISLSSDVEDIRNTAKIALELI